MAPPVRLEDGEWFTGDVYGWNLLVFDADGTGVFVDGDRKTGRETRFRWSTRGSVMTLDDDRGSRDVAFTLNGVDDGAHKLHFDREPFAGAHLDYWNQDRGG